MTIDYDPARAARVPSLITTTREISFSSGIKMAVHGRAGAGKTTLISTLPAPLMISAESGELSLRHMDIPAVVVNSIQEVEDVLNWLKYSEDSFQYQSIALDSISEIAEVCLRGEKAATADGRRAYGKMNDKLADLVREFRDLPNRHVYFSAKQGRVEDDVTGATLYAPSLPGKTLTKDFPYFFDLVFSLELGRTPEGETFRYLLTKTTLTHDCKDRSGALDEHEAPDLGNIIRKILSSINPQGTPA